MSGAYVNGSGGGLSPVLWAVKIEGLPLVQYGALCALASFADRDGYCFPSLRALSEKAGMSERSTHAATRELQRLGLITISNGGGGRDAKGRPRTANYQLHIGATLDGLGRPRNETTLHDVQGKDEFNLAADAGLSPNLAPDAGLTLQNLRVNLAGGAREDSQEDSKGRKEESPAAPVPDHPPPARAALTRFPKNWTIGGSERRFALGLGLDAEAVFALYSRHRISRGQLSADWPADWEAWCLREVERNRGRPGGTVESAATRSYREVMRRIDAYEAGLDPTPAKPGERLQ